MPGQSPLIDTRVDGIHASDRDRRDVEGTLPRWLRLRCWWQRKMSLRFEDGVRELGASEGPGRLVAPVLTPILLVPAIVLVREPDNRLAMLCLLAGVGSLLYALVSDAIEQRVRRASRIQTINVVFYAAMISLVLAIFVATEHPREHLHWVVFFLYFLLIGSVGLTDNPRQAVVAGSLSVVGYCTIIVFVHQAAAAGNPMASGVLAEFDWLANSVKLSMLAGAAVVAVASAERGRELRRLSLRDPLTGLLNRRAFDDCLAQLAERALRHNTALTVAMIDIDHFKRLNDQYGHATGDVVLRWVATRIERSFRASDLVARYGGEEFVVALPHTSDAHVIERLEVLRAHIATSILRELRSDDDVLELRTSVSIGVARLPADGATAAEALARAESRLCEAKRAGRNRISQGRR